MQIRCELISRVAFGIMLNVVTLYLLRWSTEGSAISLVKFRSSLNSRANITHFSSTDQHKYIIFDAARNSAQHYYFQLMDLRRSRRGQMHHICRLIETAFIPFTLFQMSSALWGRRPAFGGLTRTADLFQKVKRSPACTATNTNNTAVTCCRLPVKGEFSGEAQSSTGRRNKCI